MERESRNGKYYGSPEDCNVLLQKYSLEETNPFNQESYIKRKVKIFLLWCLSGITNSLERALYSYKYYTSRSIESHDKDSRIKVTFKNWSSENGGFYCISISTFVLLILGLYAFPLIFIREPILVYIDTYNRTIIDPFQFSKEQNWGLQHDFTDNKLVGWIAENTRWKDKKRIDEKDIGLGFFETEIFGQKRLWNISLEMLYNEFAHISTIDKYKICINSDMFGIPFPITFMKSRENGEIFLLIDIYIFDSTSDLVEAKMGHLKKIDDTYEEVIEVVTAPQRIEVTWTDHMTGERKSKEFSNEDSLCINTFTH